MSDYWERPSVLCDDCDQEYSELVGRQHAQRTGHSVGKAPEFLIRASRDRRAETELVQRETRWRDRQAA